MHVIRTVRELRAHLRPLRGASHIAVADPADSGARREPAERAGIGFVPTMGALHEGHLSLVHAARERHETVVMSIFVNPTQFNDDADFSTYPRDEARDVELAREAGVDVVFMPSAHEMYGPGFATVVRVDERLTGVLEGAVRGASHFEGMATVVTKLLLAVQADAAYFGAKDFQQVVVVRRLVEDLGIDVQIVACPTLRESDGLALSSRNVRLTSDERQRAAAIPAALKAISAAVLSGERDTQVLRVLGVGSLEQAGLTIEYLEFVHPVTLQPLATIVNECVCVVAVSTESTRLIDNETLRVPASEGNIRVA